MEPTDFKRQPLEVIRKRDTELRELGYTYAFNKIGLSRLSITVPPDLVAYLDDCSWNRIIDVSQNYSEEAASALNSFMSECMQHMIFVHVRDSLEDLKGRYTEPAALMEDLRSGRKKPDKKEIERAIRIMESEAAGLGNKIKKLSPEDISDTDKRIVFGFLKDKLKELDGTV